MKRRVCAFLFLIIAVSSCAPVGDKGVKPSNWLDLTTLSNYRNPHGDTCSEDGTTRRGNIPQPDKLEENHLKNRFLLPSKYTQYSVDQLLKLPAHEDARLERSGATLVGYVSDVKYGGGEGESCNCNATRKDELDAHIEVIADPSHEQADGRGMVVCEVTERSRRLADSGLLKSSFGNDWSTPKLAQQLIGHWVRFSGWLFYDPDHEEESWSVDKRDLDGKENWRGTPWEIHPVMAIEVLPQKPMLIRKPN